MNYETPEKRKSRQQYPPGTEVEIRNKLDRVWSDGFRVVCAAGEHSYRIARNSDGSELPTVIDQADVRRPRKRSKNSLWWV